MLLEWAAGLSSDGLKRTVADCLALAWNPPLTCCLPGQFGGYVCSMALTFSGLNMNVTTVTSVFKRHSKSPCLIVSESRHDVDEINNRNNRNKRFQERRMQGRPFSCSSSARDEGDHLSASPVMRETLYAATFMLFLRSEFVEVRFFLYLCTRNNEYTNQRFEKY